MLGGGAPAEPIFSFHTMAAFVGPSLICRASRPPVLSADSVDSAGPAAGGSLAASVDQGQFEFKVVPPGHYRLRFWPKVNGRGQSDSFYYPGTRLESQASEIEVGDGTHLEGLQFTIP